jgi:hypothetical protein
VEYSKLISISNLQLAWRRIVTGKNLSHKRFFRPFYLAYEVGLEDNLRHLHARLEGAWKPTKPLRIYVPKPSGLQRPISLLQIEDQIVYQAIS